MLDIFTNVLSRLDVMEFYLISSLKSNPQNLISVQRAQFIDWTAIWEVDLFYTLFVFGKPVLHSVLYSNSLLTNKQILIKSKVERMERFRSLIFKDGSVKSIV